MAFWYSGVVCSTWCDHVLGSGPWGSNTIGCIIVVLWLATMLTLNTWLAGLSRGRGDAYLRRSINPTIDASWQLRHSARQDAGAYFLWSKAPGYGIHLELHFSYLHPVQTFSPNSLHFFLFSYSLNPHSNHYSLSYSLATPIHDPIHIVPNNLCNPLVLSHVIDSLLNCTIIVVSELLVRPTTCFNKNYLNFSLIMFPAPDNYLVNVLPHLNIHDKFIMPSSHDWRFISFFNQGQETLVYLTEVPSYCKCPIYRPPQFDSEYARPRDRPTWSGPSHSKHVKSLKPTMDKLPVLAEFLDSGKSHSHPCHQT